MEWRDPTWTAADYDPDNNPRLPGIVEYQENAEGTFGQVGDIDQDGDYLVEDLERAPTTPFDTYLFGYEPEYGLEPLSEYRPGGYHPTHIGDNLGPPNDLNRYTVIVKLSNSPAYTVWLCRDHQASQSQYVAVKIVRAEVDREKLMELHLDALDDHAAPGGEYIAFSLNKFVLEGPNGAHQCMVFEVLGHCLDPGMWLEWDQARDNEAPRVLRKMCHQVTQAMAFLHNNGICHGDFRPANIGVKLRDLDGLSEDEVLGLFDQPKKVEVRHLPTATNLEHQPKYLVHAYNSGCLFSGDPMDPAHISDEIAVTGFGRAFLAASPPRGFPGGDRRFQPPELALGLTTDDWPADFVGYTSDLWALGWTLVCIRTQRQFFQSPNPDLGQDEFLAMVVYFLGIPPFWSEFWPEGDDFFDGSGAAVPGLFVMTFYDGGGVIDNQNTPDGILEQMLARPFAIDTRYLDIWPAEVVLLGDLVRLLCRYDPAERIPAQRAIDHEFFDID
ncbi:kinase-like domain-containing protein [Rhypophila decipiens]|uniref:Kinase-like domain-containing protein n=1 Tax=Rhypophila decipiens TaxID=261697 RepID=A0AAN7B5A6_9PEZI|nr:kinase-like domain-containing protein [Rhypophila decipiens]